MLNTKGERSERQERLLASSCNFIPSSSAWPWVPLNLQVASNPRP